MIALIIFIVACWIIVTLLSESSYNMDREMGKSDKEIMDESLQDKKEFKDTMKQSAVRSIINQIFRP